jgi:predicted protein tyrosine phosphatase
MEINAYYGSLFDMDVKYLQCIHNVYKNFYVCGILPLSGDANSRLSELGIGIVVSVMENKVLSLDGCDIINFHYASEDIRSYKLNKYFDSVFKDLTPHLGKKILFHCNEGKSRSVALLLSVLLRLLKGYMSPKFNYVSLLLKQIQKTRKHAKPNAGFLIQLRDFEAKLKQEQVIIRAQKV